MNDCSPGPGEIAQDGGTRGGTFYGETDRCRESIRHGESGSSSFFYIGSRIGWAYYITILLAIKQIVLTRHETRFVLDVL